MSYLRLGVSEVDHAVRRLVELLGERGLSRILNRHNLYLEFQSALFTVVPHQRAEAMARMILMAFGDNLLFDSSNRSDLCIAAGVTNPKSLRPSSSKAINLTVELGLSSAFAGYPGPPKADAITVLGAQPVTPPLFDYQIETMSKAVDSLLSQHRALISLPTGCGKTRVGTEVCKTLVDLGRIHSVVWLAHTDELCEQAVSTISTIWQGDPSAKPAVLSRFWGGYRSRSLDQMRVRSARLNQSSSTLEPVILVSTPRSLASALKSDQNGDYLRALLGNETLVMIDEAHRAAASSYTDILRLLGDEILLAGLSATAIRESYATQPYRGTEELRQIFGHLIEPLETLGGEGSPEDELRRRGILAEVEFYDLGQKALAPSFVAEHALSTAGISGAQALHFAPTVAAAIAQSYFAVKQGLRAQHVSANTPTAERQWITHQLRQGSLDFVSNCELLTTGFDSPNIDTLYLARSTISPVLYKQMIGRGLRGPKVGGTATCKIYRCGIDFPFPANPNTQEFARSVWG